MAGVNLTKLLLLGCMLIICFTGCGESPALESISTEVPPTELPPTPARTPFPASCAPADSSILELIHNFEVLAKEKNVEGTMALFTADAILDESFQSVHLDTPEKIKDLWEGYYEVSLPFEFRDIQICEDLATFTWTEIGAGSSKLWPVLIEVTEGKISFMDFYEDGSLELDL